MFILHFPSEGENQILWSSWGESQVLELDFWACVCCFGYREEFQSPTLFSTTSLCLRHSCLGQKCSSGHSIPMNLLLPETCTFTFKRDIHKHMTVSTIIWHSDTDKNVVWKLGRTAFKTQVTTCNTCNILYWRWFFFITQLTVWQFKSKLYVLSSYICIACIIENSLRNRRKVGTFISWISFQF